MTIISSSSGAARSYFDGAPTGTSTTAPSGEPTATLPEPSDTLTKMLMSGDYGSSLAAMLMLSQKERRQNAKNERDNAYLAVENAQRDQLEHMKDAADLKFATGLAQGGLQLTSAGLSLGSVQPGLEGERAEYKLKALPEDAPSPVRDNLIRASSEGKGMSQSLGGSAKAMDAFGTITGASGKLLSDAADREVTRDEQRVTTLQRVASDHASDADDASKSIDKTVDLFHEYVSTQNATLLAATQRA